MKVCLLHVSGEGVCACCLKMYQTLGTITLWNYHFVVCFRWRCLCMLFEDVPDSGNNYAMKLSLCCVFQVMVFVHARNETVRTAMLFRDFAKNNGQVGLFLPEQGPQYGEAQKNVRLPHHFFKFSTNRCVCCFFGLKSTGTTTTKYFIFPQLFAF